jgi:hypothetical protein
MQWLFSISFQILLFTIITIMSNQNIFAQPSEDTPIVIVKSDDFSITGDGTAENWGKTEWIKLTQRSNHENSNGLQTNVKVLYSDTGLYFLFHSEDKVLTATIDSHFQELWREDVVEVFLWPDQSEPVYFEYEISPLNYELPILVSNNKGKQSHWIPVDYSYKDERKTRHMTSAEGGEKTSGASITKWIAEFYIPFELLRPLKNIFPEPGTTWRANFYRIDYDRGPTHWSWQPYKNNFHDYKNFGAIQFE